MWRKFLAAVLLVLAGTAWASDEVLVDNAWLRESVPGQDVVSLQLNLTVFRSAQLVQVSSPWASSVEIQRLSPGRGKMRAHAVGSVRLARNRALAFGERGFALMLLGLKQPLNAGDHVPLSLVVEFAGKRMRTVQAQAEVRPLELSYKHYQGGEVHDHR